jgi:hypothetical protein
MEAAVGGNDVFARTQVKVISIAEDDLRSNIPQIGRPQALDRRLSPDRHKHRRLELAMKRHGPARPRARGGVHAAGYQLKAQQTMSLPA